MKTRKTEDAQIDHISQHLDALLRVGDFEAANLAVLGYLTDETPMAGLLILVMFVGNCRDKIPCHMELLAFAKKRALEIGGPDRRWRSLESWS